jgi:beta-lactamase superfamily II metal-dependent hydrolase
MDNPQLVVLDVGHGNCAVLFNTKGIVVFDAGPGVSLLEFLTENKIQKIDAILISHADKDHIEGVGTLLAANIVEIGLVKVNSDALKDSQLWDDLIYQLNQLNAKKKLDFQVGLTTNDTGKLDYGDIMIEILAPNPYLALKGPGSTNRNGQSISSNTISAVIRLTRENIPLVLISGDIDDVGLGNLKDTNESINAPIWVFPHHGGRSGQKNLELFAAQFTELVEPDIVIFSMARSGNLMNPQPDVVKGVRNIRPEARILCTQLSKHCAASVMADDFSHLAKIYSRGREARACCAGSIAIDLSHDGIAVLPEVNFHRDFIIGNAPTALCRNW